MPEAVKVLVRGRVQGVGFRPFVYRISTEAGLAGTVQNNMDGVRIIWEGDGETIRQALERLKAEKPRTARIDSVETGSVPASGRHSFNIVPSDRKGTSRLVIPVDTAVCDDCLREMHDPSNFRYRYPFINCTQCGPRYTIIDRLPYDRPYTSMKTFPMCETCAEEYCDPLNRRHHAQPIACGTCGPYLSLLSMNGELLGEREHALKLAVHSLEKGGIVAIKGIGGYHLACNAADAAAVARLRKRKGRPEKPLAIMAASIAAARRIAILSPNEEHLLRSPEAPIVLLEKGRTYTDVLSEYVAPGIGTVGVMLPYTPLHHLLFDDGNFSYLIMTSANPSGLPILYEEDSALAYLNGIADQILTHNRPILHAIDDSVVRANGKDIPFFLRRARGYVPDPIDTAVNVDGVVAMGSQMKNTFAIGRGSQIIIGPHLGDLSADQSLRHYEKTLKHLMTWTGASIRSVAVDMHPLYSNREIAERMGKPMIPVQHHHAHLVSCMADNRLNGSCLGLILDGTGYGADGNIWGFEVLYGGTGGYRRLGHLRNTPLPGGDRAVREPWRNAAGMLISLLGSEGLRFAEALFPEQRSVLPVIGRMINIKLNSPQAGTCGRLFDAVSAMLGLCPISTYDGEAAIRLSELAETGNQRLASYPFQIRARAGLEELDMTPALRQIAQEHLAHVPAARISLRFHETVVSACCDLIGRIHREHPEFGRRVVLSGGSFNNRYLSAKLAQSLRAGGYSVYTHRRVPCGDGGLSLGQLMIAAERSV